MGKLILAIICGLVAVASGVSACLVGCDVPGSEEKTSCCTTQADPVDLCCLDADPETAAIVSGLGSPLKPIGLSVVGVIGESRDGTGKGWRVSLPVRPPPAVWWRPQWMSLEARQVWRL